MWFGNDTGGINRAFQIAGQYNINLLILPLLTERTSLLNTIFVQLALSLSLHNLIGVIYRLAMSY